MMKSNRRCQDYMKKSILDEFNGETPEELLDFIIDGQSSYFLSEYYSLRQSAFQRFNSLWVYPLYAFCVIPFQYLFFGKIGFERDSKVGKVLDFLVRMD